MSEHFVTLVMNTAWKGDGEEPERDFIACVTTLQDASWLLCTAHAEKAERVAAMFVGHAGASFDVDFGCEDSRFGDVWSRLRMTCPDARGRVKGWPFLGQGSFGSVFAGTLMCQPHPLQPDEWVILRQNQLAGSQKQKQLVQKQAGSQEQLQNTTSMRGAIKIPIIYVEMLKAKNPDGTQGMTWSKSDLKAAEMASDLDAGMMRNVMLDEIKVMHTLLFGVKHVEMGELNPEKKTFKMDAMKFRAAADDAHKRACTEGHRFLNHLLEFSTASIPCTMTTLRQGDLTNFTKLNPHWGTLKRDGIGARSAFAVACYQVYHGLRYMHSVNFVHMDIKPDNILHEFGADGEIRCFISDFGLSSPLDQPIYSFCGTPIYAAPEVETASEKNPAKDLGACDAYSFAITMLSLLLHSTYKPQYLDAKGRRVDAEIWQTTDRFKGEGDAFTDTVGLISRGSRVDKDVLYTLLDMSNLGNSTATRGSIFYTIMDKVLAPYSVRNETGIDGFSTEPAMVNRDAFKEVPPARRNRSKKNYLVKNTCQ